MIDTHTHLYLPEFADNAPGGPRQAVERALSAGVSHMILPNVDLNTIGPMQELHALCPDHTSMAMGLHPTEVNANWRDTLAQTLAHLSSGTPYVAIGEIGIDLYWDRTYEQEQMQVLELQLQKSIELNLPVIIHCREGLKQTLEVLQSFPEATGVMHSFSGSTDDVEQIRATVDFHFGINGIVTFKNSSLRNTLPAIGLDRLLLETDSPYLAPVPHRGKRNESAFLPHIAQHIAQSLSLSVADIDRHTTANAINLFHL